MAKYIQYRPEGVTAKQVGETSDSDLLDIYYFLIRVNDLADDELEEEFHIDLL